MTRRVMAGALFSAFLLVGSVSAVQAATTSITLVLVTSGPHAGQYQIKTSVTLTSSNSGWTKTHLWHKEPGASSYPAVPIVTDSFPSAFYGTGTYNWTYSSVYATVGSGTFKVKNEGFTGTSSGSIPWYMYTGEVSP